MDLELQLVDRGGGAELSQAVAEDLRWRLEEMDGMGNLRVERAPGQVPANAIRLVVEDWPALAMIINLVRWRVSEAEGVAARLRAVDDELEFEGGVSDEQSAWLDQQRARLPG